MKRYINLLPPQEQRELRSLRINGQVRDFGIWFLLSLGIMIMFFVAIRFYLKGELANSSDKLAAETNLLHNLETSAFRDDIERFNAELGDFKLLQSQDGGLSGILIEIAQTLPWDMTLDVFLTDQKTGRIEIGGRAANRDSVLAFRRALLASSRFTNINFPLSNLETPRDLKWEYSFYFKNKR